MQCYMFNYVDVGIEIYFIDQYCSYIHTLIHYPDTMTEKLCMDTQV